MSSHFADGPHGGFGRLEPGSRIAGYLIEKQIGAGGMAVVFCARDEILGRLAAVKIINPAMANDPGFHARFQQESRAVAAVDSLHIIPVYRAGEADGLLYIATRFVAGGDLAALLRRSGGRLEPKRAVALVEQVASALDAAHAVGLVHRDVKPSNILVDTLLERPEHAFLSDFGLSKATMSPAKLTMTGQFVGTPHYSSPEQIRNVDVDGRTDQYALACVAFFLLTGKLPFDRGEVMATLFAQVHDPVPKATDLRQELPAAVNDVLARALAKVPDDRYTTCAEFAKALREAFNPPSAASPNVPQRPSPNVPQRRKSQDALRQTDELPGLIHANRRVRSDEPRRPRADDQPPEDLSRLIDANRRLLADKDLSGPYAEPAGHEPKGKHAAGRPPEPEQTDPGAQQGNGDAVLFSLVLPMPLPLQPSSSSVSDGGPALPPNAADESVKTDESGAGDMSGKTHPDQGRGPDNPDGQQRRWHRWTSFLPGMPRD